MQLDIDLPGWVVVEIDEQGIAFFVEQFREPVKTLAHHLHQMRVEHYRRIDTGFELEVLRVPTDILHFEAVKFGLALERIYFGVEV